MVMDANRMRQTSGSQDLHASAQLDKERGVGRRRVKRSMISVGSREVGGFGGLAGGTGGEGVGYRFARRFDLRDILVVSEFEFTTVVINNPQQNDTFDRSVVQAIQNTAIVIAGYSFVQSILRTLASEALVFPSHPFQFPFFGCTPSSPVNASTRQRALNWNERTSERADAGPVAGHRTLQGETFDVVMDE
jgi:hypothetical protein